MSLYDSCLLNAAKNGDSTSVIQILYKDGEYVNIVDRIGLTPLILASKNGHDYVVDILLRDNDIEVDGSDRFGATALAFAAGEGHLEVVKALVREGGANMNKPDIDGWTALSRASKNGHSAVVEWLEKKGAKREIACTTRLIHRCKSGDTTLVKILVEYYGTDVNIRDGRGRTALIHLCSSERTEIGWVKFLVVKHGADVNTQDRQGITALMLAAERGDVPTVKILLSLNAGVEITDQDNQSARDYVSRKGHRQVQELLLLSTNQFQLHAIDVPVDPPTGLIRATEIEIRDFATDKDVGGDFFGLWLNSEVVIKVHIPATDAGVPFHEHVNRWIALRHPNIQKLYGTVYEGYGFFVCEHMMNGSLKEYRSAGPAWSKWDATRVVTYYRHLYEGALGLQYLHERGVVHGDVRLGNILIGSDGIAKLGTFCQTKERG